MPKSKAPESSAERALENLSPMIDRIIEAESGRVLAELETLIAERVRTQIWSTLQERLGGAAPARPAAVAAAAAAPAARRRRSAAAPEKAPAGQACHVVGCERAARSMGYCSAHYQSARKYDWPRPAPEGFVPPPTPPRGRPPKAERGEGSSEE